MNTRTKTILRAPSHITESCIEGTMYWPGDAGEDAEGLLIQTTNADHSVILQRHGYTKVGEVAILPAARQLGPIDVEELGRAELARALSERGVSHPLDGSRIELADLAEGWNNQRRRARMSETVAHAQAQPRAPVAAQEAPAAPTAAALPPEAAAPATPRVGPEGEANDFADAGYDELKGWAAAHGVVFARNPTKKALREMCQQAHAALLLKKAS